MESRFPTPEQMPKKPVRFSPASRHQVFIESSAPPWPTHLISTRALLKIFIRECIQYLTCTSTGILQFNSVSELEAGGWLKNASEAAEETRIEYCCSHHIKYSATESMGLAFLLVLSVVASAAPNFARAALVAFDSADAIWDVSSLPGTANAFDSLSVRSGDRVLFRLPKGFETDFSVIVAVPDQGAWEECDTDTDTNMDSAVYVNGTQSDDDIWLLQIT
jgi:hypothetical protein